METLRPIAQQALARAKDRKAQLVEDALRCHDECAAKEREIAALRDEVDALNAQHTRLQSLQCRRDTTLAWMDGFLRSLHQEIAAREQCVDAVRKRMALLVLEIKQESCLLAFDPECDWKGYETCDGRKILQRAWNGMGSARKWQKEVLITVCFRYHAKKMRMPVSLLEQVWCEETPAHIRHDRDFAVCLSTVARTSEGGCPIPLAGSFLEYKPFVTTAVKFFPEVLINNLLPERFWGDKDVFLAYTEFNPEPFQSRGRWVNPSPNVWENDIFRALVSRFSAEIRGDKSLMLALVKVCGMCLRHIAGPLSADLDIIRSACQQDPISFWSVPLQAQYTLLRDKPFMLHLFDRWPLRRDSDRSIRQLYRSLPVFMQADPDIVDQLLSRRLLRVHELSVEVPRNRDFWLRACRHASDSPFPLQIPVEYRNDPEFMVLFRFESLDEIADAIRASPQLAGDRSFWTAVINSGTYELQDAILNHAVPEIRQDRDLMLLACKQEAYVYQILDSLLKEDREIVEATLLEDDTRSEAFFFLPLSVQTLHPDLTTVAIRHVDEQYIEFHQIAADLRTNVEVLKAWLDNNSMDRLLDELPDDFPEAMKDNEAFCLHATRYCYSPSMFKTYASEALRSKKGFMLKAVALNPICLFAGAGRLSKDLDIAMVAFSHQIYSTYSLFGEDLAEGDNNYEFESELEFLRSVATQAREKVVTYEGFTQAFLFGLSKNAGADCALPMLSILKRSLAEMAGVPAGSEVARLRAVSLNLLFMCMADEEDLAMYCSEVPGRGISDYF